MAFVPSPKSLRIRASGLRLRYTTIVPSSWSLRIRASELRLRCVLIGHDSPHFSTYGLLLLKPVAPSTLHLPHPCVGWLLEGVFVGIRSNERLQMRQVFLPQLRILLHIDDMLSHPRPLSVDRAPRHLALISGRSPSPSSLALRLVFSPLLSCGRHFSPLLLLSFDVGLAHFVLVGSSAATAAASLRLVARRSR